MQKAADTGTLTPPPPSGETVSCNDHRQRTDPQRMNGNLVRHL
jgi:hypothetical protein